VEPDRLAAIAGRLRGKAAGRSLPFFIQRFFEELCNQRNGAVADEIVSADYVSHGPQASPAEGPDGVRARIAVYQNAPEGHWDVQEILSAGEDRVVVRWIGRGTHTGELMGAPATGASIACDATTIFRIADGKIAEEWTVWDALGLLQQGGAVPCPPEPIWVLDRRSAIEHLRTSWHSRREAQAVPARSPASLWSAQARKEPGERPTPARRKSACARRDREELRAAAESAGRRRTATPPHRPAPARGLTTEAGRGCCGAVMGGRIRRARTGS